VAPGDKVLVPATGAILKSVGAMPPQGLARMVEGHGSGLPIRHGYAIRSQSG